MTVDKKRQTFILMGICVVLLVPFVAMQFTNEVNWKIGDFIVGAILLSILGFGIDFILRKFKNRKSKYFFLATFLSVIFLVWMEMAVDIFGTLLAGN